MKVAARFLTLPDVAETLNVSLTQVKALVRTGDLPAIKVGGRGAWRVESSVLEDYIQRLYAETRQFIRRGDAGEELAGRDTAAASGNLTGASGGVPGRPSLTPREGRES